MKKLWKRKIRDSEVDPEEHPTKQQISTTYVEHYLTLKELANIHVNSFIDPENPENSDGLNLMEAEKRLKDGGKNIVILPKDQQNNLKLFLKQFLHKFWILLLIAAVISLITYTFHFFHNQFETMNLYCSILLIVVVGCMSYISYSQEKDTINVATNFKCVITDKVTVIRENKEHIISCEDIVVGDIIVTNCGQVIPADIRIIKSNGLVIDASEVTGIMKAEEYYSEPVARHINVFDAKNVAFKGSFCLEGDSIGVCIRTGSYTTVALLTDIQTKINSPKSALQKDLDTFVNFTSCIAVGMAFLFFLIGIMVSKFDNIMYYFVHGFLIVVVASIPQGLPAVVMSQFAIISRRMARKNVFIKKPDAIDNLGAATVICTDKKASLTQNLMKVTKIWYNGNEQYSLDENKRFKKKQMQNEFEQTFLDLISVMAVCNKAQFEHQVEGLTRISTKLVMEEKTKKRPSKLNKKFIVITQTGSLTIKEPQSDAEIVNQQQQLPMNQSDHGKYEMIGAPIEVALLKYIETLTTPEALRMRYIKLFEIPFNSVRRWQLVVARCQAPPQSADALNLFDTLLKDEVINIVMIKGAPEVILSKCSHYVVNNQLYEIDKDFLEKCKLAMEQYGCEGCRVLGFAQKHFISSKNEKFTPSSLNYPQNNLIFLGMAAIIDPPRPEARNAIKQCKDAGIKVYMITGDHPTSAAAIASQIGLITGLIKNEGSLEFESSEEQSTIVLGESLKEMTTEQWNNLLKYKYIVFARTTPDQKLQIIEELQKRDEIVAVTGGNVNDVPALAKANVGIAMGQSGSEIAQRIADIIVTDDNFASIVKGIEEGRLMFDNLRMAIAYTLSHLWAEILPLFFNFTLGLPLGLEPLQILSIDLATELPPSIALAYEQPERDLLKVPPRSRNEKLVTRRLLLYSYGFAGCGIALGCFAAYLSVYSFHGISLTDLFYTSKDFWKPISYNFTIANGNIISANEQMKIRGQAAAAWQITLVVSQIIHLFMCKTRRASIFTHEFINIISIFAVIIELALINLFVYTPIGHYFLDIHSPPIHVWIFPLIVGCYLIILNETRKFFIRKFPNNKIVKILEF